MTDGPGFSEKYEVTKNGLVYFTRILISVKTPSAYILCNYKFYT